jgi:hypothetical protein
MFYPTPRYDNGGVMKDRYDIFISHSSDVNIPIGTVLTLEVKLDNFEIKNRVETMIWNGRPENVLFLINVPQNIPKQTYLGKVIIRHKGLLISTLNFVIKISNKKKRVKNENSIYFKFNSNIDVCSESRF